MSGQRPTLWILEPKFKNVEGHYFSWTAAIAGAARARGWAVEVFCGLDANPAVRDGLIAAGVRATPIFPDTSPRLPGVANQVRFAGGYTLGLRELARRAGPSDIALTFSGTLELVAAAARFDDAHGLPCPLVVQFFAWDYIGMGGSHPTARAAKERLDAALVHNAKRRGRRLIVAGQTAPISRALQRRIGAPVATLPFALDWARLDAGAKHANRNHRRGPVVGTLGGARDEKGFGRFMDAIQQVQPTPPIFVQTFATPDYDAERLRGDLDVLAKLRAYVVNKPVQGAAFGRAFASLDILVLPYAPKYAERNSSLLGEALGMGKVAVAPAGTWLGDLLSDTGTGVVYDPTTPDALVRAIERAVKQYDTLRAAAAAVAPGWRAEHSPNGYLDALHRLAREARDGTGSASLPHRSPMASRTLPLKGWRASARNLARETLCVARHARGVRRARRYAGETGLKLNIGCGPNVKPGWVNIDFSSNADLTLDLREPLPFDDASCDVVYSEHFFEHLDYPGDAEDFLAESLRVLAPGGLFSVGVPDTAWPIRDYVGLSDDRWAPWVKETWHPAWCETPMEHLNYHFRQGTEHRFAYDAETLVRVLERAGFVDAAERPFDPELDNATRQRGGLYVDARKP